MRRRSAVLIGLVALAACGRHAPKSAEAAPAQPAPTSAEASHNWASVKDRQYLYYPRAHGQEGSPGAQADPTTVRYLGRGADGAFTIAEIQPGAATMLASCVLPCTEVRMHGNNLDTTASAGGDSVTRSALDDAVHGRLEVYPVTAEPAGK